VTAGHQTSDLLLTEQQFRRTPLRIENFYLSGVRRGLTGLSGASVNRECGGCVGRSPARRHAGRGGGGQAGAASACLPSFTRVYTRKPGYAVRTRSVINVWLTLALQVPCRRLSVELKKNSSPLSDRCTASM